MNGAECHDQLSAYECQCLPGYSGINCETDINECQQLDIQCQHGGTCLDKVKQHLQYFDRNSLKMIACVLPAISVIFVVIGTLVISIQKATEILRNEIFHKTVVRCLVLQYTRAKIN